MIFHVFISLSVHVNKNIQSKCASNSLKQIYRTYLITVCFVHNVPSFFAIIVLTLWYIRNTSGMVRGLFGIPSVRVFGRNDTYVFTSLWHNATFLAIYFLCILLCCCHHKVARKRAFFVHVEKKISTCTVGSRSVKKCETSVSC